MRHALLQHPVRDLDAVGDRRAVDGRHRGQPVIVDAELEAGAAGARGHGERHVLAREERHQQLGAGLRVRVLDVLDLLELPRPGAVARACAGRQPEPVLHDHAGLAPVAVVDPEALAAEQQIVTLDRQVVLPRPQPVVRPRGGRTPVLIEAMDLAREAVDVDLRHVVDVVGEREQPVVGDAPRQVEVDAHHRQEQGPQRDPRQHPGEAGVQRAQGVDEERGPDQVRDRDAGHAPRAEAPEAPEVPGRAVDVDLQEERDRQPAREVAALGAAREQEAEDRQVRQRRPSEQAVLRREQHLPQVRRVPLHEALLGVRPERVMEVSIEHDGLRARHQHHRAERGGGVAEHARDPAAVLAPRATHQLEEPLAHRQRGDRDVLRAREDHEAEQRAEPGVAPQIVAAARRVPVVDHQRDRERRPRVGVAALEHRPEVEAGAEADDADGEQRRGLRGVAPREAIADEQRREPGEQRGEERPPLVEAIVAVHREVVAQRVAHLGDAVGRRERGQLEERRADRVQVVLAGGGGQGRGAERVTPGRELVRQIEIAVEEQRHPLEVDVVAVEAREDALVLAVGLHLALGVRLDGEELLDPEQQDQREHHARPGEVPSQVIAQRVHRRRRGAMKPW